MALGSGCINAMVPGRIKFDPEFYPDAPWVPREAGPTYLALVQSRCPIASGATLASLRLEERRERAWVSADTDHSGIVLEWGSCFVPPSRILSGAAAEAQQSVGVTQADVTDQKKEDEKAKIVGRLERELRDVIRPATRTFKGRDTQAAFLRALRGDMNRVMRAAGQGDPQMAEQIKRAFRAAPGVPARTPPRRVLRLLQQELEAVRSMSALTELIEAEGLL